MDNLRLIVFYIYNYFHSEQVIGESMGNICWILAVGGLYDNSSFEQREAQREKLLRQLDKVDLKLAENVWVYDSIGRAQILLEECSSRSGALQRLKDYRRSGMWLRIRPAIE